MKEKVYIISCLFLYLSVMHAQPVEWSVQSLGSGKATGKKIWGDNTGHIIVSGTAGSSATLGGHALNSGDYVARFSNAGTCLWVKNVPGEIADIESDASGNIYLAGSYSGTEQFEETTLSSLGLKDIYVAELDPDGNVIWLSKAGGKGNDEFTALTLDFQGGIYLTGLFTDTIYFASLKIDKQGELNAFAVKYDNYGAVQWTRNVYAVSQWSNASLMPYEIVAD
ncbi:MAG: hypothetical protein ACJ76F_09300, partial [Bacteroidia bacterium]